MIELYSYQKDYIRALRDAIKQGKKLEENV